MSTENNGFKEVKGFEEIKATLDEIEGAWKEICDTFEVDPEIPVRTSVLTSSIKMTLMDLNQLENLEYVKKSGKPLEKLHETYIKDIIKFGYSTVEGEDSKMWEEEVDKYVKEVITAECLSDSDIKVENNTDMSLDMLIDELNRVFSIANQLNVIKGMESGSFDSEPFMGLINNFIYFGIGLVQRCNGNAVIMGEVVTFLKVLIKTNDIILKQISQMLMR